MKPTLKLLFTRVTGMEVKRPHPLEDLSGKLFLQYRDFTMIPERLFRDNLKLAHDFRHLDGCVVECGVWRGGMVAGLATMWKERMYYLFDSFEGLPKAREIDGAKALAWQANKEGKAYYNNCTADIDFAERAMKMSGARHAIVKGWFDETLPKTQFESGIALLRLDGDWYDSIMVCLVNLFPKVVAGGLVILDDYYTWDGCSRAVHDYLSETKSTARIHRTTEGVPYMVKL